MRVVCVCVCVSAAEWVVTVRHNLQLAALAGSVPECTKERFMFSLWLFIKIYIFLLGIYFSAFSKKNHCAKRRH